MGCLMLRFDAPMMSFGGVLVDQRNPTDRFPGRSMLTGLIANALGWTHANWEALNALQSRITFAARWDVPPEMLRDYQTVDLGDAHLARPAWTTWGQPEHRKGGSANKGTHQRYRMYWANGVMTLAIGLSEGEPDVQRVAAAIARPARPVFFGRKCCLPGGRIVLGIREARHPLEALRAEPRDGRADAGTGSFEACWPRGCDDPRREASLLDTRTEDRDWRIQAHVGSRPFVIGSIQGVPPCI